MKKRVFFPARFLESIHLDLTLLNTPAVLSGIFESLDVGSSLWKVGEKRGSRTLLFVANSTSFEASNEYPGSKLGAGRAAGTS